MSYTVPYSFVPGTKARAQEMNANFAAINDSFELIDENKVNLDLSNISSAGLDVIKNNSSIRNIGEVIISPIPLTDSGLHLLDGSVIPQSGIYHDFVNYIKKLYNKNSTYNPDVFEITGSLTVTGDGVASGFSAENFIKTSEIDFSHPWSIKFQYTTGSSILSVPISFGINDKNYICFKTDKIELSLGELSLTSQDTENTLSENTSYFIELSWSGTKYTLKVYNADETLFSSISVDSSTACANSKLKIGYCNINQTVCNSNMNLKTLEVHSNETAIFTGKNICNYFTDEETWQNSVTTYGTCGKFVYNSAANTVRLPKITGIMEVTTNVNVLGDLVEAGLPNITGSWIDVTDGTQLSKAVYEIQNYGGDKFDKGASGGWGTSRKLGLNASRSSSIYGKSNTVQPQTVKYLIYIVLASTAKTDIQVNIDNIATNLNEIETNINWKANVDLTNITNTGKIAMAHNAMPSDKYVNLTLGASGTTYTAPADGWFYVSKHTNGANQYISIQNDNSSIQDSKASSSADLTVMKSIAKGHIATVIYNAGGVTNSFRFIYAVGAESEAN